MAKHHLFSNSLYNELFRRNIISPKGYVIASDEELQKYHDFLVEQAKDKTSDIYKERKKMMKEVKSLLRKKTLNKIEVEKLSKLLESLNLEFSDDGLLVVKEPDEIKPRCVGASEPNQTLLERQLVAKEKRDNMLKQDLKVLNKWLDEISRPSYKILRTVPSTLPEQKKIREKHGKERTRKRHERMAGARRRFLNSYHQSYEKGMKSRTDTRKTNDTEITAPTLNDTPGKDTTYYTAESHLNLTESDHQEDDSDQEDSDKDESFPKDFYRILVQDNQAD